MLEILAAPEKFQMQSWQAEDLEYLEAIPNSANWSSMGTYKSSTGLWLIDRKIQQQGNALIVTTKSGKGAFYTAIPRCLDDDWSVFNVGTRVVEEIIMGDVRLEYDIEDFISQLMGRKKKTIVLAHYHCFVRKSPLYEILLGGSETGKIEWDMILLDEAHKIKSKDVQWSRGLKKIARASKHRHLMTGTGFVNNPAEMYSLLNFLEPDQYSSYWRFRRRFCEEENWNGFDKIVGIKDEMIDEFIKTRKHFGPRRTMQEVHSNIAEPVYSSLEVELNPTQRRMYKETVKELMMLDQQGYEIHSPNVVSQLQRLRQISVATPELVDTYYDAKKDRRVQVVKLVEPSSKLDALMEILEGLEWDSEDKQQMIVFSSFRDPLSLLKKRLDTKGIPYLHMEQKDSEQTRFEKWHNIFPKKEHQVFLSTIALGGESISLSCAQYCVFLDRSWSPAQNSQAVGRIYRPGQTGVAEIIHINANKTVDQKVLDNVTLKTSWFKRLFDDTEL